VNFEYKHPTKVLFGENTLEKLGEEASVLGKKALVVTGRTFAKKYGYIDRIRKILEERGVKAFFFSEVEPNPSIETVKRGVEVAKMEGVDLFIAFGGGSPMDAAKAIDVVYAFGGAVEEWIYPNKVVKEKPYPIIAIPTTHGTGSEVTKYSVLTDTKAGKKVVVVGEGILPDVAILDSSVLEHLPKVQAASTGLDALSHAIEAYFSKRSNPLSDLFALESTRIVFESLPCSVEGDMKCREQVFYASMLAGYAINIAGTNIGHGLGYELTVRKGLPHGFANLMILPEACVYYERYLPDKTRRLLEYIGLKGIPGGLKEAILLLKRKVGAPMSLREIGVTREELDSIIEKALTYERNLSNSPVELSREDVRKIFENIF